jgi:hypothetical protein
VLEFYRSETVTEVEETQIEGEPAKLTKYSYKFNFGKGFWVCLFVLAVGSVISYYCM